MYSESPATSGKMCAKTNSVVGFRSCLSFFMQSLLTTDTGSNSYT